MKCLDSLFESYITPILLSMAAVMAAVLLGITLFYIVATSVEYGVNSKEIIDSHCVNNTVVYRNTLSGSIATAGQACSE